MRYRILILFLSAVLLQVDRVIAQSTDDNTFPSITATYLDKTLNIDGRVDEPIWQRTEPASLSIQGEPVEGAPAEEKTNVWVLYDKSAIYVGAKMYDSQPERIGDQIVRRDEQGVYDYFELSLDSNNDRLTGYLFRVSAAGVQGDVYLFDDTGEDEAWDAVWQSAVHHDSTGWSAELRIPISQLRYDPSDSEQTWGVNFSRKRLASNELTYFALESRLQHGRVSVFGRLHGLHFSRAARRFEIRPYVLGSATKSPVEKNDPFSDGSEFSSRTGFELRYGLGGDYTLDVTVNPDFGQVEVDPAVINLTAFETFFPEKRPFFIEDAQIFDFDLSGPGNQLFYGRRIGREPQGSAPDDIDFEESPTQTTILGAAKLTGRTAGGLEIGILTALTSEETGRAYSESLDEIQEFKSEPRAMHAVVRARQDFRDGASQLGGIVTAMHRNLPSDGSLDFLNTEAYTFGIDFMHNWGGQNNRSWGVTGHFAGSAIKGPSEAITEVQSASNHYFQRPDAVRYSLDTTATSMTGAQWELMLRKLSGEHWTGTFWLNQITPGFEANDIGFSTTGEQLSAGGRIGYREIKPSSLFRNYEFTLRSVHDVRHSAFTDFSRRSLQSAYGRGDIEFSAEVEFLNYWGLSLGLDHFLQHTSDNATRGGPLMTQPAKTSLELQVNSDHRKAVYLEPSLQYVDGQRGGYEWETELATTLRPAPGWEIEMEPGFSRELDPAQYVETIDDPGYTATFGQRYIFGELKRQTLSLETRLNVAFNPKLTVQFYAQSFVSSGKYQKYKQLQRPESFAFDSFEEGTAIVEGDDIFCTDGRTCVSHGERYFDVDGDGKTDFSFDDEDFNIRSLKLNAVLRWEYRPGSTLFLVWQHSRRSEENIGAFDLDNSLNRLWSTRPDNAIILKFNYWLDL